MKIVRLEAEGFKRLRAVEIAPDGNMVVIAGRNGAGKSSILDAIWVAIAGRSVAPPKPVRKGEEQCRIHLDLGEIVITRTFIDKGDKPFTDTVKVESAEGLRYPRPQEMLDNLLGVIGFDPFEFTQLKPAEQAEQLLAMVPLPIDLDEHAELDASDYEKRRDANRDIKNLEGQLAGIPREDVPKDIPDRDELVAKLGNAANHNMSVDREGLRREEQQKQAENCKQYAENARRRATELRAEADKADEAAKEQDSMAERIAKELAALGPVPELIDTDELREQIRQAENATAIKRRQESRAAIEAQLKAKQQEAEGYTAAMAKREREREEALSKAKMPVDGLGFQINDKGKPVVTFNGVPFEQASKAEQLRASTAIAMTANPTLRVLQIRDGSLLDEDSMKMLTEMAEAEDFQIWCERVGTEGVGIIIEDGAVRGAPVEPEPDDEGGPDVIEEVQLALDRESE